MKFSIKFSKFSVNVAKSADFLFCAVLLFCCSTLRLFLMIPPFYVCLFWFFCFFVYKAVVREKILGSGV